LVRKVVELQPDHLDRLLSSLQTAEFIYEQPSLADPDYTFKHALTRQVAYDLLLNERRRMLHHRTAEAIESLFAARLDDHLQDLARHYLLTTDYSKAIRYSQAAAQQAADRSAYAEAANTLDAALKLLERLPDDSNRMRIELALRTTQQTVLAVQHGFASDERLRAIERICELSEKLGEAEEYLRGLVSLGQTYFPRGAALRTVEIGERCLELTEGAEDSDVLASVHAIAGFGAHACGRLDDAASQYQVALFHTRRANRRGFGFGPIDPWTSAATQLACVLLLLGRGAEAVPLLEEGFRHARDAQDLPNLGLAHSVMCWFHQYRREPEVVRTHAEASIALAGEHGLPEWLSWGKFHRGWAQAELGELETGVSEMEVGIAGFDRIGGVPRQQFAIAMLAQGYQRLGRCDEALVVLDQALARAERSGEMVDTAEMLRLRGEWLLIRAGLRAPEAERCLRAAVDLARAQQARWWELRATASLARLLRDTNRRDEARAMLADIYNWFTEGFDTADLKDAKALLTRLTT
jgi:tetratricopeptide (TPR) repeat protein